MISRLVRKKALGAVLGLLLGSVSAAEAQIENLAVTGRIGAAVPAGQLSDYMKLGATLGLQVSYPLGAPLDLVLAGDLDALNGNSTFYQPDIDLWRYRAGVEAELLGRTADNWGLRAQVGAGGTTFRSRKFFFDSPDPLTFRRTYFTGTGGIKLLFGKSARVGGHVGAMVHWTPMDETDTAVLRQQSRGGLESLSSALTVPVTIGLRFRTS
jgi:hypothetical protein